MALNGAGPGAFSPDQGKGGGVVVASPLAEGRQSSKVSTGNGESLSSATTLFTSGPSILVGIDSGRFGTQGRWVKSSEHCDVAGELRCEGSRSSKCISRLEKSLACCWFRAVWVLREAVVC